MQLKPWVDHGLLPQHPPSAHLLHQRHSMCLITRSCSYCFWSESIFNFEMTNFSFMWACGIMNCLLCFRLLHLREAPTVWRIFLRERGRRRRRRLRQRSLYPGPRQERPWTDGGWGDYSTPKLWGVALTLTKSRADCVVWGLFGATTMTH